MNRGCLFLHEPVRVLLLLLLLLISVTRSLGLLGGYCFYDHMTTSKLFSLQRGVLAGLATTNSLDGENKAYFEGAPRLRVEINTMRGASRHPVVYSSAGLLMPC